MLEPKAFKAYDVAGSIRPRSTRTGAYRIGRAYVEQFSPAQIAVGRDMRVSSPSIAAAVREGAADGGADVLDLGLVGTEMVYFAVGELGLDGGIAVTASHNPKQYTGMKIVRRGALPVGGESGPARRPRPGASPAQWREAERGEIREVDIWDRFVDRVLSFVDVSALRPLKVVIDAANGMAGAMLPPVLERLPTIDVVRCYFEPDGTFPNHEPNPLLPENREFIVEDVATSTRTSGSRSTATPTGASSSTTAASSFRATSSRHSSPNRSSRGSRAGRSSTTSVRPGRCRKRSSARAARHSSTASGTRSSRRACAR